MSIYYCQNCDRWRDDDWNPMGENETCDECLNEGDDPTERLLQKMEDDLNTMKADPFFNKELRNEQ